MKPQKALSSIGGKKSGYRLNPFRSSSPVGKSGTGNRAEVTEDESFLWELHKVTVFWGFPGGSDSKEYVRNAGALGSIPGFRSPGFDPWVQEIPWRRAWQPTPVFLPGESPWTQEPVGYSLCGRKQLDRTEWLSTAQHCICAQRISWTGEPGRLWSIGSQRADMTEVTEHGHHCHDQPSLRLPGGLGQPDGLLAHSIHPLTCSSGPHLTLPDVFPTQITPL